jgi:UDP-glucose 4-epimerase
MNAYGGSKLAVENILSHFSHSTKLNHVSFRYFNVAGADSEGDIGECHIPEIHLIPLILDVANGNREAINVFGTDCQTPYGTCMLNICVIRIINNLLNMYDNYTGKYKSY